MNERIRQLSDIAYANHLKNNPNSSFGRRTDYDKEFAELIIRECCKVSDEIEPLELLWKTSRFVKLHFGIEE